MNVDTEVAARPAVRGPSAGAVTLTVNHEPRLLRIEPGEACWTRCGSISGSPGRRRDVTREPAVRARCGDGRRVLACLTLAVACEGREVTTIEGPAAADGELHPDHRGRR